MQSAITLTFDSFVGVNGHQAKDKPKSLSCGMKYKILPKVSYQVNDIQKCNYPSIFFFSEFYYTSLLTAVSYSN